MKPKTSRQSSSSSASYISAGPTAISPQRKKMKTKTIAQSGTTTMKYSLSKEGVTYIRDKNPAAALAIFNQRMLESSALLFRSREFYGPEDERKTCIWPGGDPVTWTAKSSGISWIGVNGTDTVCVVSMREVTRKRPAGKIQLDSLGILAVALADMAGDTSYSFSRRIAQSSRAGPFAVVSVAPSTSEVPGECSQECQQAINFLMEKLKDRSSLSSVETTQIAVCALKYLMGPKFKSNEVEAMGSGKWQGINGRMKEKRVLNAINKATSFPPISLSSPLAGVVGEHKETD